MMMIMPRLRVFAWAILVSQVAAFLSPAGLVHLRVGRLRPHSRAAIRAPGAPAPFPQRRTRLEARVARGGEAAGGAAQGASEKVEEAIARCREAVARKPENEEAWFLLGVLLQETGELEDAQEAFEKSTALNAAREAGWLNLGMLAQRKQDTPSALRAYMGALQTNPSSGHAYVGVGAVMEAGSKSDAAEAAYEKALTLDPALESAHAALCKLFLRVDRPDSARQAAQRGLEALPDAAGLHAALGAALVQLTRPREAERALRTAIGLDSGLSEAYNSLGIALKAQGKYAEAEAAYKTATQLAPGLLEPLYNLGIFYREQGALYRGKARETMEQALAMDPTNMDVRLVLAALDGGDSDIELPRAYIERLFDSVAETYEENIIPVISYQVPNELVSAVTMSMAFECVYVCVCTNLCLYQVPNELVTAVTKSMAFDCGCASGQLPANQWTVLDIGCGTGLSGAALRGTAAVMAGCDVSAEMCRVARRKGMYATVAHADAVEFMLEQAPGCCDLVVAGDVLPYIKDLTPLFAAAARMLKPGARFVFTTEEDVRSQMGGGKGGMGGSEEGAETGGRVEQEVSVFGGGGAEGPVLNARTRYWHSQAYVGQVCVCVCVWFCVCVCVCVYLSVRLCVK